MQDAVGALALQWQDRPEGAAAECHEFLAAQRRCRHLRRAGGSDMEIVACREDRPAALQEPV